ncbi:MAG: peptidoglycan-binding protein [Candidatus Omnitrophica bacterium]|nr:peptidoglycan-binding protein [Candidatus Omnitrophota bacterium]
MPHFRHPIPIVSLVLFSLLSCGCEKIYYLLQKEGAEEKQLVGEALPLEANEKVEEVQKLLKLFGYPIGNVDGKIGPATRASILQFQKNNDLDETRFIDKATWEKLHMFDASGLTVKGNINIQAVQMALINAGFTLGKADGVMGNQTKKALVDFQKSHGLRGDAVIGMQTLKLLEKYLQEDINYYKEK